jgi:hypothetical protein
MRNKRTFEHSNKRSQKEEEVERALVPFKNFKPSDVLNIDQGTPI